MSDEPDTDQVQRFFRKPVVWVVAGAVIVLLLVATSRRYKTSGGGGAARPDRASQAGLNEQLLPIAMDKLFRLEEFEGAEMMYQAVDQLDQWIQNQKPIEGWQVDPMVAALPEHILALSPMKDLGKLAFTRADGPAFQEAILMRDLSKWVRGDQVDGLERAKRLFDWTVRNIQLVQWNIATEGNRVEPGLQTPMETLLLGEGTPIDRAWVFVLLARQQGLDAVLLALYDPNDPTKRQLRGWCAGVLIDQDLYLFEPSLGMPIPAPGGIKRSDAGALEIQPATLAQVAADDSLLRQLDLDEGRPYPVKASQLKEIVAMLEASPSYLRERMKMVEMRLVRDDKVVLSTSPSGLAARLKKVPRVGESRLWLIPYQILIQRLRFHQQVQKWQTTVMRPFAAGRTSPLAKGRMLHLKGKLSGEPNATDFYQLARPSDRELDASPLDPESKALYRLAKLNSSYWLGLTAVEQNNSRAAVDYFAKRVLDAEPGGPWTYGARYNLGRVYETLGEVDKAVEQYESDSGSPGYQGNMLRARWLGSKTGRLPADVPPPMPSPPPIKRAIEPAAKPAVKAETRPTVKAEAKPEAKPEVKREAKPEVKPEARPDPKERRIN